MPNRVVTCSFDSYANQDSAAANYGSVARMKVNGQTSHKKYVYLFFPKPFSPAAKGAATVTVTSAILTFYLASTWTGGEVVTAKRITGSWLESKVNFNNAPAVSTTNDNSVTISGGTSDGTQYTVDLTNMLQDVAAGSTYYGIRLEVDTTGDKSIYSSEATNGDQPTLNVTWAYLPIAPTDLKPTDTAILDTATSVLVNWTFQDADGTATQSKSRVQVDDSSDLSSPLWDSGDQPNTTQQETLGYEIKLLSITGAPTGGTLTLTYGGNTTSGIAYNASPDDVAAALNALASITSAGGVTCSWLFGSSFPSGLLAIRFNQGGTRTAMTSTDSLTGGSTPASHLARTAIVARPGLTVTMTSANPGVVTLAGHGLRADDVVVFETTGALPTNVVAGQPYFVLSSGLTTNTFEFALTSGGTAINTTSGSQSGTHTLYTGVLGIALSNNSVRYWRVRVTDSNGGVSGYSLIQSFTMTTKGTVTISYPGSTLREQSPEVQWTLSSGTQASYQVILTEASNGFVIWDSTRVASTDQFVTIPAGLINDTDSGFYNLEVRVWDTLGRVPNNNDPAYSTTSLVFTYTPNGAAANVLTLTAVPSNTSPAINLTWTRAAAPDYFAVQVSTDGGVTYKTPSGTTPNGETWDRLVPGNYLVSGTTYTVPYYQAKPQSTTYFQVNAVVLSAGVYTVTTGDPTASATPDPPGLWFVHSVTGVGLVILTPNQRASYEWDLGEEAVEYYPLGRQDPVRVTTSMRGYEGTVQGEVRDYYGLTAEQARENLEAMKAELGQNPIRLIVQGLNFPVRLGNIKLAPVHPKGYQVSIDFTQTAEFDVNPPSL